MNNEHHIKIIDKKVRAFDPVEFDFRVLSKYKKIIFDNAYFDFIIETLNGGFFFEQALHVYGYSHAIEFHDIDNVNGLLQQEYGAMANGLSAFAQDVFGNQFVFDSNTKKVGFFNIETGEVQIIASSFVEWASVILNELDYFTGINVVKAWTVNNQLYFNQRLCPKKPFVIGGEYKIQNLYASVFPNNIKANANIARQIYNLPDGTPIELKIIK